VTDATATAAEAAAPARLSEGYVRYALVMLLAIYTLNFVDRQIVAILGGQIKADLNIDDGLFGLLGGLAFALFYTVLGIPIARFAERGNRVGIIAVALAIWSGFTALCGMAANFWQLLAFRIGVGVGEAGCTPPAHSLISDYVPPEKRASALALYSMGVPIGSFAGFAIGALIATHFGWRAAFFAVGLPGVVLALIAWFTLKEPRKLGLVVQQASANSPSMSDALKELASRPTYIWVVLAATAISFVGYGHAYFVPLFLARVHHMPLLDIGLGLAFMTLFAGVLGTWLGGVIADWAAKRDKRIYMTLPAVAPLLGGPAFILALTWAQGHALSFGGMTIGSGFVAIAMLAIPTALNSLWYGPVYATVQGLVHPRSRATAVAIMFFVLNLIALGFGPWAVGALSDFLAALHYGGPGFDAAALKAACPQASTDAACLAARATGVREAVLYSGGIGILATLCFFVARFSIRRDLEAAAGANT
jgi:predicted MFS family arabinose efflux permease